MNLTKEQFLALASELYDQEMSQKLNDKTQDFFEYESVFATMMQEFNRKTLEASLGELPSNPRKKKSNDQIR
jgi:hypothetical protein